MQCRYKLKVLLYISNRNVSPYHNIVDKPNALQIENRGIHVSTTKLDNFLYESDMNKSLNFLLVSDPSYDGLITASEFT